MVDVGRDAAPFNMALNTLERVGGILTEIKKVSSDPYLPLEVRQATKVHLVKQFFIQASPLLKESVVKEYEDKFEKLKPFEITVGSNSGGATKIIGKTDKYDITLDNEMNKLVIEIQRELQRENYFMPPKKDKGRAVAEF